MSTKIFHLEKIQLSNFRSISEPITLQNLENIVVLIGPNGGGKTNILKAIHWSFSNNELSDENVPVHLRGRKIKRLLISSSLLKVIDSKKLEEAFLELINEEFSALLMAPIEVEQINFASIKYVQMDKYNDGTKEFFLFNADYHLIDNDIRNRIKKALDSFIAEPNPEFFEKRIVDIFVKGLVKYAKKHYSITLNEDNHTLSSILLSNSYIKKMVQLIQQKMSALFNSSEKEVDGVISYDFDAIKNDWKTYISGNHQFPSAQLTLIVSGTRITLTPYSLFETVKNELIKIFCIINEKDLLHHFFNAILPEVIFLSQEIEIKDSIKKNETWKNSITDEKEDTSIYYRIFSIYDIDLETFDREDISTQDLILNNALIELSQELQRNWKQEKLKLRASVAETTISFSVYDLNEQNNELRACPPSLRSRGFKWYLSYFLTLKYVEKQGNTILLLDDPAVFLHESGQKDFLKSIEDVSRRNQVFYTTHLISLFDEKNLERILLVKREGSKKTTFIKRPWNSTGKHIVSPIYHALGFDQLIFKKSDKIIFVEGISDKFILEGLQEHLELLKDYYIHPISGGNKLEEKEIVKEMKLLRCLNRYKNIDPIFILDGDRKPIFEKETESEKNYIRRIIYLGDENQEIEDLINRDFYLQTVQDYYSVVFSDDQKRLLKLTKIIEKIKKSPEDTKSKLTKSLQKEFNRQKLGDFSKVGVSIRLKRLLRTKGELLNNFGQIIDIIRKEINKL